MDLRRAHVRVPCSTSNLGAGFDCIGLALDRHLEATFEPGGATFEVERSGTTGRLDVAATHDVLVVALRERIGARAAGLAGRIRVSSTIPVGRGLGSSAAARIAGYALGAVALGERFSAGEAWVHATRAEGHPDNAAPCAFGGLVAVVPPPRADALGMQLVRLPLSDAIGWAFAAPAAEVPTDRARAVLPRTVGHETAVDSLRRMPALLRGLETADADLLATGFGDTLHVPHRLPLIPGGRAAMDAAMEAGAWAVTISGSGSGLIAVVARGAEQQVAAAMAAAFREVAAGASAGDDVGVTAFAVTPDLEGAKILAA